MTTMLTIALTAAAIGSGVVAGIFFAFSTFVMSALSRLPTTQGIAAMNSINVTIVRSPFMLVFIPTAILCVGLAAFAILNWRAPTSVWLLAGAGTYLLGSFISTIAFNVPLNDALARASGNGADAAAFWAAYVKDWTWWNHVRTAASLLAGAAFVRALMIV